MQAAIRGVRQPCHRPCSHALPCWGWRDCQRAEVPPCTCQVKPRVPTNTAKDEMCPFAQQSSPHGRARLELLCHSRPGPASGPRQRGSMLLSAAASHSPPHHAPALPFVSGPAVCPSTLKHWLSSAGAALQILWCIDCSCRSSPQNGPPGSVAVPTSDHHLPATSSSTAVIPQQGFPWLPHPPGAPAMVRFFPHWRAFLCLSLSGQTTRRWKKIFMPQKHRPVCGSACSTLATTWAIAEHLCLKKPQISVTHILHYFLMYRARRQSHQQSNEGTRTSIGPLGGQGNGGRTQWGEKLPQSRHGNSSRTRAPLMPALHPSPARLGQGLPVPPCPCHCTQTQHCSALMAPCSNWGKELLCRPWKEKEVWKTRTFNIDPQMIGSPEEPHKYQIAQGSIATGWESKTSQLQARESTCTNDIYFTFLCISLLSTGVKFSPSIYVSPRSSVGQHKLKAKHLHCS